MHVILFNTKGGTSKSTLCSYLSYELQELNYSVSVGNTDQQKHVDVIDNDEADYFLYDTAGSFTSDNIDLLRASVLENAIILIPLNTGNNDFKEIEFLINNLKNIGVLEKSKFVFIKTRANSKALKEKRELLKSKGVFVCDYIMPLLEDFSEQRHTKRTKKEINTLLNEILL